MAVEKIPPLQDLFRTSTLSTIQPCVIPLFNSFTTLLRSLGVDKIKVNRASFLFWELMFFSTSVLSALDRQPLLLSIQRSNW